MPTLSADLRSRLLVTLGVLIVYRLGLQVPLPGIDASALHGHGGGPHAAAERISVFALGFAPYLTAFLGVRLLAVALIPGFCADAEGRIALERMTRAATVPFAVLQGYGIAIGIQEVNGLVPEPGSLFVATTTASLTAGSLLLAWLAGRISERGLGDGVFMLFAAGTLAHLPVTATLLARLLRSEALSLSTLLAALAFVVAQILLIVVLERARRVVRLAPPETASLPLDTAGPLPPTLALVVFPLVLKAAEAVTPIGAGALRNGATPYLMLLGSTLFISVIALPLLGRRARGAGRAVDFDLDAVVIRLAPITAGWVTLICLAPHLSSWLGLSLGLPSGLPLLVVVWVILRIEARLREAA